MLSTLALMKIAATASFRPMDRHDFMAFNGAPQGSLIADNHPDVLVIHAPATAEENERLEFMGTRADGEPFHVLVDIQIGC